MRVTIYSRARTLTGPGFLFALFFILTFAASDTRLSR